jgi:hypothetical protein
LGVKEIADWDPLVPESKTKLSSSMTVGRYRELVKANDREALGRFIVERFDERYFRPVSDSNSKHGFAIMAVACLVIETLESFYEGRADTKGESKKMFRDFFNRNSALSSFGKRNDWFFTDIRCGILHQAESRGGWKIQRKGPLLDEHNKTINATTFLNQLQKAVAQYAAELQSDETIWKNFCTKVDAICTNCR